MKTIGIGLLTGVAMLVVSFGMGMLVGVVDPSLNQEYQNASLFRPWKDPLMNLMFVHPLIMGLILTWIWTAVKGIVPGGRQTARGINYALIYWLTTLPGMLMSYSTFPLSLNMVISWSISNLVQALFAGLIISRLIK